MAAYFLDTSAVVKRYVDEAGSEWVDGLLRPIGDDVFYVAWIAGPELISALTRRRRRGELSPDQVQVGIRRFRHELRGLFRLIEITPMLLLRAMDLAEEHGLRGYDAVQLAAAIEAEELERDMGAPSLTFISSDSELNTAATAAGFQTENPLAHV